MKTESQKISIRKIINTAIAKKLFPGSVVGWINKNSQTIMPAGHLTYDSDSPEVSGETIFDVASITKSIPTSCLALQLIEQEKIPLQDPIKKFIPELQGRYAEQATVSHLLTHTINYGPNFHLSRLKNHTSEEIWRAVVTQPLAEPPGKNRFSTNAASILLTRVIEQVTGRTLVELAEKKIFQPLNMEQTSFFPLKKSSRLEIAPTENDPWRKKLLQGEVHDESAWILSRKKPVGSAGLFSTVPDLLKFAKMLLKEGTINGQKFFRPETIKLMSKNHLAKINQWSGLGWELNEDYMAEDHAEHTFGKTGFTGCVIMIDIHEHKALVILSNCVYPQRPESRAPQRACYRSIANIIFQK